MSGTNFSKFKSVVNRGVTTISMKTANSLEKAKINTHLETLNEEINKLFYQAGKTVYEMWINDSFDFSKLDSSLLESIKNKKLEIDHQMMELRRIDERDKEILGSTQGIEDSSSQQQLQYICPKCHTIYHSSVNFCRNCGQKMQ